jgi:tight adherence protein B
VAFLVGFFAGFVVLFVFYKIILLAVLGGVLCGIVHIFISAQNAIQKRKERLRMQFFDMLEAMIVSMRAGQPVAGALASSRNDLLLIYPQTSDIIAELDIMLGKFHNSIPLSEGFSDFAERSGLEDIASFASIYATIDGKSSRTDQIVREIQQIISDKMEIEMEIETLMTAAKSEVNIMLFMPLVILLVIGYAGAGFMDVIYTTVVGRVVSSFGLLAFIGSYLLARSFSKIRL